MELEINQPQYTLIWPRLIENSFDFENGQGLAQLNLRHLFSSKDCQEIYQIFDSNLNWIIRDGKKLEIPDCQVPMAEHLNSTIDFFRCLLQQNIPEKDHVRLTLETLRVARSDGTQHQVGSRWHQDHEAYFTLIINLTENSDPNVLTRFYHLEPNEKYKWDKLGNAIPCTHWRESFIQPFHLGIINSGIRYFLFPFDRCRPIIHRAPQPSPHNRRLAVFATFSISGLEQGMDLKDAYIPHLNEQTYSRKGISTLKNLRDHWRNVLGIEKSIHTKNMCRLSQATCSLYKIKSISFTIFNRSAPKQHGGYSQHRIANFGLRQFGNSCKTESSKLLDKAIPIGALSRALCFFSKIGEFSIKNIMQTNASPLATTDCSLSGNNNYDLLIQFREPKKAFQLLSLEEILGQIDQIVLILYRGANNYFYPPKQCDSYHKLLPFEREKILGTSHRNTKQLFRNETAQIFASFSLNELHDIKTSFFLSHSIETAWNRGVKILISQNDNEVIEFDKNKLNKLIKKANCSRKNLRGIDEVPFFLPRTGINRTLQGVGIGSQLIKLSRKIVSKNNL